MGHIAALRIVVEQSMESIHICCVDFQEDFDSIIREILWKLLRHYGVPVKIVICHPEVLKCITA